MGTPVRGTRIVAQALLAIPDASPACFVHWTQQASVPHFPGRDIDPGTAIVAFGGSFAVPISTSLFRPLGVLGSNPLHPSSLRAGIKKQNSPSLRDSRSERRESEGGSPNVPQRSLTPSDTFPAFSAVAFSAARRQPLRRSPRVICPAVQRACRAAWLPARSRDWLQPAASFPPWRR